jgi:DNA-binding CsgD family transcriptional regulator
LLKLVGEARELRDAGECARAHVLEGLSRLLGAPVVAALTAAHLSRTAPAELQDYVDYGWTDGERDRALAYYGAIPITRDPLVGRALRADREQPVVTLRRADLVTDTAWYGSRLHNELHRPGGLDDVILSMRFLGGEGASVSGLVLKRGAGDPPFSVEEREIVHLFRSECDWMLHPASGGPRTKVPGLTRREQETLDLLLTGASEKIMAARLGISRHTVHDYVKRLYRKIGVSSRAALMAQHTG